MSKNKKSENAQGATAHLCPVYKPTDPKKLKPYVKPSVQRAKRKKMIIILAGLLTALVLAGGLIVFSQQGAQKDAPVAVKAGDTSSLKNVSENNALFAGIPQDGLTLGNPDAKITINEYADLRCPACKYYSDEVFPTIVKDLIRTGKINYTFHAWPITYSPSTKDAENAAIMTIAAANQDKLYEFQQNFYSNQGDEATDYATNDFAATIGKASGLNTTKLLADIDDASVWSNEYSQTQADAATYAFTGTPSFTITTDGETKVLSFPNGVPSADDIKDAIKNAS